MNVFNINKKFIFCGPFSGLKTGQSSSLNSSYAAVPASDSISIDIGGAGLGVFSIIFTAIKSMALLFRLNNASGSIFYVTPSRSFLGAIRDLPFNIIAKFKGFILICHWHGGEFLMFRRNSKSFTLWLLRKMWGESRINIALSDKMAEDMSQLGFLNVQIIPNYHEIPVVDFPKKKNSGCVLRLIFLSNLIREKGIVDAIKAHQILRRDINVELHVIGAFVGKRSKEILQMLELPGVIYHGPLYGEKKIDVLANCDILIFPSYYPTEAFPLVLLEAMACGLAVVAYKHNYIEDFFNHNGGILVSYGVDNIVAAVASLNSNRDLLYDCKISNLSASQSYSLDRYQSRIYRLIAGASREGCC